MGPRTDRPSPGSSPPGLLGSSGLFSEEAGRRAGAAITIAGWTAGYPLGLRYVRRAAYRVTAGDVGTLVTAELLGTAAAGLLVVDTDAPEQAVSGVLTAGFGLGALVGDRALVRRFDHTEAEARLLLLGTVAGSLIGLAFPALT